MRVREGTTTLSATDLANHLSCPHLTALNLRLAKGEIKEPLWEDPHLRMLQQRGSEHEKSYIESLRSKGVEIIDLSTGTVESAGASSRTFAPSTACRGHDAAPTLPDQSVRERLTSLPALTESKPADRALDGIR